MHYLSDTGLYSSVQVFNLAILPGTAFRQEATMHQLDYQSRPPYYVLKTPTIDLPTMYQLMEEAEEIFDTEFDAVPSPVEVGGQGTADREQRTGDSGQRTLSVPCDLCVPFEPLTAQHVIDFNTSHRDPLPPPAQRCGAFELILRADDFRNHRDAAYDLVRQLLDDNPHSTLRLVFEPTGHPQHLTPAVLQAVRAACLKEPSYLDRYYSMQLGRPKGAKHLVIRLPWSVRDDAGFDWIDDIGPFASIVWTGQDLPPEEDFAEELEAHEFVLTY